MINNECVKAMSLSDGYIRKFNVLFIVSGDNDQRKF